MPLDLGWVLRPWEQGLIDYMDLITPDRLSIWDIRLMNMVLDVRDENQARAQEG